MRVLTVRQPWAAAIFDTTVPKRIENRTWTTSFRGAIGIHAAVAIDDLGVEMLGPLTAEDDRDRGHVLGTVRIAGMHRAGSDGCADAGCYGDPFAMFPALNRRAFWHWELSDPRRFVTPIPAVGALQLWEAGPSLAHLIEIADIRKPTP